MIYHVYNRTYDDISHNGFEFGSTGQIWLDAGIIYRGSLYRAYFAHYCPRCNSTFIGKWEFYDHTTSVRLISKHIIKAAFEEGKTFSEVEISKLATAKKEDKYTNRLYEEKDTKMYQYLKEQQNIAEKILSYRKEFFDFVSLKSCPICGHELHGQHYNLKPISNVSFTKIGGTISAWSNETDKLCFIEDINLNYVLNPPSIPSYYRGTFGSDSEIKEHFESFQRQRLNAKISKYYEDKLIDANKGYTLKTPNDIKEYLKQCLIIEKNIFSLRQRFNEIYILSYFASTDAFAASKMSLKESSEKVSIISKKYDELKNENPTRGVSLKNFEISKPEKPIAPPRPSEPILKKPGLFNKKKVLAENELLMKNYNDKIAIYEAEYEKYQVQLKDYQLEIKNIKQQEQKNYEATISKLTKEHEEKCNELLNELNRSKIDLEELEKNTDSVETPEKTKFELISTEKEEAEELLKQYLDARDKLYSFGIIFEKYFCDIVAISSFYEYFASGRCEKLTGVDGAYNIYENEIRMDVIISELDQVVDSLEQIKKNQFMIYTAISETNRQLNALNDSMKTALNQISTTNYKPSKIADNTEVIAYNAERTAFYAQKNAELTNALGYLIALT